MNKYPNDRDLNKGTLVLQSHKLPLPYLWLQPCLDSVKQWAQFNEFDHILLDDSLFTPVPLHLMEKTAQQRVIATDLARLMWIKHYLQQGYQRVVWCDADFLIFSPESLLLPQIDSTELGYAFGREVWVQYRDDNPRKLKAYVKLHNAFMWFERGNSFLDFYLDHAIQLLEKIDGPMPPQFIGPKLVTALHNVVQCPVQEEAAMFSPAVVDDLLSAGDACCALNLLLKKSRLTPAAANLCSSLQADSNQKMLVLVALLQEEGLC